VETPLIRPSATFSPSTGRRPSSASAPSLPPRLQRRIESRIDPARVAFVDQAALVVVELPARQAFTPPPGLALLEERRYGIARIVFLRWGES